MSASSSPSSPGSYDPVLITSTTLTPPYPSRGPTAPSFPRPKSRTRLPSSLRLTYPYPLPPTAILDLAYTVRHIAHHPTPLYLLLAAVLRGLVLALIVGCSTRWRSRGGWVAGSSGISIGAAVWMGCEGVMRRGKGGLMQTEEELDVGVQTAFLIATAGIAASEYILFLLLLRLSPAGHRTHPLALRLPPSAIQSPTAFSFTEETLPPPSPYGPRRSRGTTSSGHRRYPSQRTFRSVQSAPVERDGQGHEPEHGPSGSGPSGQINRYRPDDDGEDEIPAHRGNRHSPNLSGSYPSGTYESYGDPDHDHNEQDELDPSFSEDDFYHSSFDVDANADADADPDANSEVSASSDASSISESSIIDLPPPLRPNRIIPPSLSMNNGISLAAAAAAIDSSPVLGPLVRRSRSARFLGRSWGDRSDLSRDGAEGVGEGEEMEAGRAGLRREYGTFQQR